MRPIYMAYYGYLLLGIAVLAAIAYAIPHRVKKEFPSEWEKIQNPPSNAARTYVRDILLATGDSRLRMILHLQGAGFYIWAWGGILFTVALFIWD